MVFDFFSSFIMQSDMFQSGAELIQTIVITVSIVSGMGATMFMKIKGSMKQSERSAVKKAGTFIENYVIPVLEEGAKVAEKTKGQEEKLKQFGEVLYDFMGQEAAGQITGKPQIKLDVLNHDVTVADGDTKEYHEKVIRLQKMARELGLLPLSAPQAPITDKKPESSFISTNPYDSSSS
ncbi:MAG: hypothetical protein ACM3X1_04450 [Ignavibacteriales bacterium]